MFPRIQTIKNLPGLQETWVQTLGQEAFLEKGMSTHSSIFLPGEFHGQRSLENFASTRGCKITLSLFQDGNGCYKSFSVTLKVYIYVTTRLCNIHSSSMLYIHEYYLVSESVSQQLRIGMHRRSIWCWLRRLIYLSVCQQTGALISFHMCLLCQQPVRTCLWQWKKYKRACRDTQGPLRLWHRISRKVLTSILFHWPKLVKYRVPYTDGSIKSCGKNHGYKSE